VGNKKAILTIELVPRGQWGSNLRSELPKSEWDSLRGSAYANAGHRCEICGGKGPKWPVECHERWEYDEQSKVQRLIGLIALCPSCHKVKHIGRTMAVGNGDQAIAHIMRVNGWSKSVALDYIENAFEIWGRRSDENWSLDISWLKLNNQRDDNWAD
jgi:hypothetical protein